MQWHPINEQDLQTEHFSVFFQLNDLISDNIKYPNKVKTANVGFDKNELGDLMFFYKLVEYSIKIPVIYENIKKIYRK